MCERGSVIECTMGVYVVMLVVVDVYVERFGCRSYEGVFVG